ncbi:MAG TPA: anaerobic sulfatase maturase [Acidobacteriota bacterium]|nr:anaerobic sulfatase maturase [Acidobacteriota bacterium]
MGQDSRDFQVFAKPIGPLCNMACRYCYYIRKQSPDADIESLRMPETLLEEYIVQHIAASRGPSIAFSWHGGEPTLLGLDYFKKIVALQRKHLPGGKHIFNGMQTNGLLLDEEWSAFLGAEAFGVGLSLDGPQNLHDHYRLTRGNTPTHRQVLRAFELLKRSGITCDILCAVHDENVRHPLEVYRYFREIGARYLTFLPIVVKVPGSESQTESCSVPPEDYGSFLCDIFDEWTRRDIGRVSVQIFEEAIRPLQGSEHSLCIFRKTCGDIPVVEHNGEVFSCDHFVDPSHRIGNILEVPFAALLESSSQRTFGEAKRDALPRYCRQCEVLDMCNGGCPKDRFFPTPEGEPGLNYLCAGFKRFFSHCRPFFQKVIGAAAVRQAKTHAVGRNDPCPCGSGLKYKKCCLGKKQNTEDRRQ